MTSDIAVGALVVTLPLYNFLANRWPPFNGGLFVPMNLGVTAIVLGFAFGPVGLTSHQVLGPLSVGAVGTGLLLGILTVLPLFVVASFDRGARLVRDERVAGLRGKTLAYQVLVRIPLGTALLEEIAFRGVLFAAWRDSDDVWAAVASSAVFGLWHVGPTINLVRANRPGASPVTVLRAIGGAVVFTTFAGMVFAWLRIEGGLLGPLAMHATVNALATIASVRAARRVDATPT